MDEDHSLVIETAGEIHGAHYICIYRGLVESAYFLEIVPHEKKILVTKTIPSKSLKERDKEPGKSKAQRESP